MQGSAPVDFEAFRGMRWKSGEEVWRSRIPQKAIPMAGSMEEILRQPNMEMTE
jgi:hypothetical protein